MSKVIEIRKLLELLEEVKKRPRMFFYPPDAQSALNYLRGFEVAYEFLGGKIASQYQSHYEVIQDEHGWELTAHHPMYAMVESGMDDASVIQEMLELELETWRRVLAQLEE